MQISKNTVVAINYSLTDDDGTVIDSSAGKSPLNYLHGARNIISGLEEALEGKEQGAKLDVAIPPEKGYGVRMDNLIMDVPVGELSNIPEIKEGMQLEAQTNAGVQVFTITKVSDTHATLDGNHPLAGMNLNFNVEVVEVREATEEEITHGHVHGPGGHHH